MNTITYLFGESKFPELSEDCKLKGTFVDLSSVALIRRFIKVHRNQVVGPDGFYCDGRHLLGGSVISALLTTEYMRAFQELLRITARMTHTFRIVVPTRLDDFLPRDNEIKARILRKGEVTVSSRPMQLFKHELSSYDAWDLSILSNFEAIFPEKVYSTTVDGKSTESEEMLTTYVNELVKSPLELSRILGVNSLRIEPVRGDYHRRLFIHYSFIDIYNHAWRIQVPGKIRRREQILDVIDAVSFNGMKYDDLPPGMADAALPWGLVCAN